MRAFRELASLVGAVGGTYIGPRWVMAFLLGDLKINSLLDPLFARSSMMYSVSMTSKSLFYHCVALSERESLRRSSWSIDSQVGSLSPGDPTICFQHDQRA